MLDLSKTDANFKFRTHCPHCPSSDAYAVYDDGSGYCFSCGVRDKESPMLDGAIGVSRQKTASRRTDLLATTPIDKRWRGISPSTMKKYGYHQGQYKGRDRTAREVVHVADVRDQNGTVTAQHVRLHDPKDFAWVGKVKQPMLFGQHLWNASGKARRIVVCEGEIDTLSVAELQECQWPVVGVTSGAPAAHKDIANNLHFLEQFDEVVLCFDMDAPGREAALKCAQVLSPGKARIAELPMADANDMHTAKRGPELMKLLWNARKYTPSGIVTMKDVREQALSAPTLGLPWCFPTLTENTYGRHFGQLILLGAGTGIGKTDFINQQIAFDVTVLKEKVGVFFFEQSPEKSGVRIAGKVKRKPFHLPNKEGEEPRWTEEERIAGYDEVADMDMVFLDSHQSRAEWDEVEFKIRHLHAAEGVRIFYVDHITALTDPHNERASIEHLIKSAQSLAERLGIIIMTVSHLTRPPAGSKSHEQGGAVWPSQFRGSQVISMLADIQLGMERDTMADDREKRLETNIRLLKCRLSQENQGEVVRVKFDTKTAMLNEMAPFDEEGDLGDDDDGEVPKEYATVGEDY